MSSEFFLLCAKSYHLMVEIINTNPLSALANMQKDQDLLKNLDPTGPLQIHFYNWQGLCATYGHFLNPATVLHLERCNQMGLDIAKRPTGGGLLFHIWDMAFSILIPSKHKLFSLNVLESYRQINQLVWEAVAKSMKQSAYLIDLNQAKKEKTVGQNFCMGRPTVYDVMIERKKVIGAAQRRKPNGILHQTTLSLFYPDFAFVDRLLVNSEVVSAMKEHTFTPFGERNKEEKKTIVENLQSKIIERFKEELSSTTPLL